MTKRTMFRPQEYAGAIYGIVFSTPEAAAHAPASIVCLMPTAATKQKIDLTLLNDAFYFQSQLTDI